MSPELGRSGISNARKSYMIIHSSLSNKAKASMVLALLKGSARDKFQQMLCEVDMENAARPTQWRKTPDELFQMVMDKVNKLYFPILHVYQKQIVYMQHSLQLGSHMVCNFATR
jgi:hypothetical protein